MSPRAADAAAAAGAAAGGAARSLEEAVAQESPPRARTPDQTLKQTYTVAYIAHTPLEPRAALADWKEDKLTVWTGTQRPFGVRSEMARALASPRNACA